MQIAIAKLQRFDLQKFIFFDWGFFLEEAEKRQNPANQAYADLQLQQEVLKITVLKIVSIKIGILY